MFFEYSGVNLPSLSKPSPGHARRRINFDPNLSDQVWLVYYMNEPYQAQFWDKLNMGLNEPLEILNQMGLELELKSGSV